MKATYLLISIILPFLCFGAEDALPETIFMAPTSLSDSILQICPPKQYTYSDAQLSHLNQKVSIHTPLDVLTSLSFVSSYQYYRPEYNRHKFNQLSLALIKGIIDTSFWTQEQKQETFKKVFYEHSRDGYFETISHIKSHFPNIQEHLTENEKDQILRSIILYGHAKNLDLLEFILQLNPSKTAIAKQILYMAENANKTTYDNMSLRMMIISRLYKEGSLMFFLYKEFPNLKPDRLDGHIIRQIRTHIETTDPLRIKKIKYFDQYIEFKAFEESPHEFLGVHSATQITLDLLDILSFPATEEDGAYLSCRADGSLFYRKNLFKFKENDFLARAHIARKILNILHIDRLDETIVTNAFEKLCPEHPNTPALEHAKTWLLDALKRSSPLKKR